MTALTLEKAKYKVHKASSAAAALAMLKKNLKVDLIITDYNMPEMNGLDLVLNIKRMPDYLRVPIFFLTTEKSDDVKRKALQSGVTAWIQKPFNSEKLLEYVKKTIGG